MADVVVVGGGVGGLSTAVRLGAAGHRVTLVEQAPVLGGKVAVREGDGFSFDTGPSLLTLPDVVTEAVGLAGSGGSPLDLVRLDPQIRYWWPDGSMLEVADDPAATAAAFDELAPGGAAAWWQWDERGARIWEVAERTFFAGPMGPPLDLLRRLRRPSDLWTIDGHRTLAAVARRTFADPRLVQWAGRYATYSGSSPERAPATMACISHVESAHGVWYPRGGMGAIVTALASAAQRVGVEVRVGEQVVVVETDAGRREVRGVRLASGERLVAPVVVANVDADHLYRDLLPDRVALGRVRRAEPSTSGLVVLAGVEGRTEGIRHHNVWFSAAGSAEFDDLFRARRLPRDPTIYASVATVTDPDRAPAGCESWFLLVNAPAGWSGDAEAAADDVLARLSVRGVDLRPRLRFREVLAPADFARRYGSRGGAIYGTSSNGRRAAFLRPGNRGAVRGLYLVGGSSHPGGGLPLVAISARIVADLVTADQW